LFSRLRGYTEAEIGEFEHFITLSNQLNMQMGDEDYCFAMTFEIKKIVTTPSYDVVDDILFKILQAAST